MVSYRKLFYPAIEVNIDLKLEDTTRTHLKNELNLYTDGSKNKHRVGESFVAHIDGNRTFLLDGACSVFQAELIGVL